MNNYDDIINLPHYVSKTRKHMSLEDRAAQFAPFAALTGYDDEIRETARMTSMKIDDEQVKDNVNYKLNVIKEHMTNEYDFIYFIPDKYKEGGKYESYKGRVRRIDEVKSIVYFEDKFSLKFDDILDIYSEDNIFDY